MSSGLGLGKSKKLRSVKSDKESCFGVLLTITDLQSPPPVDGDRMSPAAAAAAAAALEQLKEEELFVDREAFMELIEDRIFR